MTPFVPKRDVGPYGRTPEAFQNTHMDVMNYRRATCILQWRKTTEPLLKRS